MTKRTGLVAIASLIGSLILVFLIGGRPTAFFASEPQRANQTPKRIVQAGVVENVRFDPETGKILVTIRMEDQKAPPRPKSAEEIPTRLAKGNAKNSPFHLAVQQKGKQKKPLTLEQKADKALQVTEKTMKEMQKLIQRLDKLAPVMEGTMREVAGLAKDTRKAVPEFSKTNKQVQLLVQAALLSLPTLKGTSDDIRGVAKTWKKVGDRVDTVLSKNEKKLTGSLDRLDKAVVLLSKVFSDDNAKNLSVTLQNSAVTTKKLNKFFDETNPVLEKAAKTFERYDETITIARRAYSNLEKATVPLADGAPRIMKNLDETSSQLNETVKEVRAIMRAVTQADGTVQKLLTDPSLYNRLDKAAYGINRLVPLMERIMRDVEIFSDRIARHPEVLGAAGVVRPSSGLKTLPTRPIIRP